MSLEDTLAHIEVDDLEIDFNLLLTTFYADLFSQIALADSKAQLIIGVNAILSAVLVPDIAAIGSLLQDGNVLGTLSALLIMITAVALAVSIFYSIRATIPNVRRTQQPDNLFFFGDIAQMREEEYLQQFFQLSPQQIKISYITQIHARAKIVKRKFALVRWGLIVLTVAFCFWVLAHVFESFIH